MSFLLEAVSPILTHSAHPGYTFLCPRTSAGSTSFFPSEWIIPVSSQLPQGIPAIPKHLQLGQCNQSSHGDDSFVFFFRVCVLRSAFSQLMSSFRDFVAFNNFMLVGGLARACVTWYFNIGARAIGAHNNSKCKEETIGFLTL
jgi:hypothetical protein